MGSHSVTCYATELNAPRYNPSLAKPLEGWKAELNFVAAYIQ